MSLISIITVNFNQPDATLDLLKSIAEYESRFMLEIIVIDNGSKQDPESTFLAAYPEILYIRSEKNLGFAGGNNLGIKAAAGDLLFLVNNDTEFRPELIERLADTLIQHPKVGIISPKILYYDDPDVIQYAGFTPMNYYTCRNHCIGQFEQDKGQYDHIVGETGYIHGAAMMITRRALEAAGPMAENFFLYYEEMDWCERVSKAGFEIWVNTNAVILHKESLSVGKNSALKEYFMNRNRILFIRRNAGLLQKAFFITYFMSFVAPRNIIKYLREGNASFCKVLLRAITWNFTHSKSSQELGYKL